MSGLSRYSGVEISEDAHIAQSVADILTTPIGSRVMRRDYGSDLPNLIDAPMNGETMVDLYMATAEALDAWEPRLVLRRVEIAAAAPGHLTLDLETEVNATPQAISVEVAV